MPIIDYDTKLSPPTYGDFLMVVMLARYMGMIGDVKFRILLGAPYREDWGDLPTGAMGALLVEYSQIADHLVNGGMERVFGATERNNFRIYSNALFALNMVIPRYDSQFIDKFLLKPQDFEGYAENIPLEPYICWHARHNDNWGCERNLTNSESVDVFNYLKETFPDKKIMVVSDKVGCDRYRRMFPDLMFSKDFSESFMGDCELVLSSEFYFAQRGGGMSVIPMFSRLPYEIRCDPGYSLLDGHKATSWATNDQKYINQPFVMPTPKYLGEEISCHSLQT